MNWDTKETWNWIVDNEVHKSVLEQWIGNELMFVAALSVIITDVNRELAKENQIEMKNVNGNELYLDFCELFENEQEGWCSK